MSTIIETLDSIAAKGWWRDWQNPAVKQFVLSGDAKVLAAIPKFNCSFLWPELLRGLPQPDEFDAIAQRFLKLCMVRGIPDALGQWMNRSLKDEAAQRSQFAKACSIADEIGCSKLLLAVQVARCVKPLANPQAPTPAGEFLLSLDDKTLCELVTNIGWHKFAAPVLTALYASHAPDRWKNALEECGSKAFADLETCVWLLPLKAAPEMFLGLAARAFEYARHNKARLDTLELGSALHQADPRQFHAPMERLCVETLLEKNINTRSRLSKDSERAGNWLVANSGKAALPHLQKYCATEVDYEDRKNAILAVSAATFKRDAIPLFEGCFEMAQPEVQLKALKLWIPLMTAADMASMTEKFRKLLASEGVTHVASATRLSGDWNPAAIEDALWPLLAHKSRPVRDAAAASLAKLGDARLTRAKELWAARRTDARIATVSWLRAIGTPSATAELKSRLEDEESDDVRDAILLALDNMSGGAITTSPAELQERVRKTIAKLNGPPVEWLDLKRLPAARLKDGSPLSNDWVLYLLYRQSRVKEMRADIEAHPLLAMLDRQSAGDLALAVAQAYFASKADADDRWAMAFAALIGNDRLVPLFTRQIKEWADNMRGKLAEFAVQALALLGTDAALLVVDAMAIRYRSKNKNIGKAAAEAFAAAAEARGVTVEELGDLVVPWLNFKPGEQRIIDAAKTKVEVRISSDFKIFLRDATTGKKISKLPDSVSDEIKSEFKEMSAGLKEAVKSQLLRMETLMVRQFRWPAARWQELYLGHPLLLPFAQRLVWAAYDSNRKIVAAFRALEDQSLTDAADESFSLPPGVDVGIVHPLELSPEMCQSWLKHLADYDVVPPFAQLERPVVIVKPDQKNLKFDLEFEDTELNGMTFKGRAERLGWSRGSVCDGGGINFYLKRFPGAGADVFLAIEGMYMGMDMESNITLGKIFFTKHGSVQIGSYAYDEPGDEQDGRLIPFGDVAPIAFSEAMGDLARIAGKDKNSTEETGEQ